MKDTRELSLEQFLDEPKSSIEDNLRALGFHSLHPDIVSLYYGHIYASKFEFDDCLIVGKIRSKWYLFTEKSVPVRCRNEQYKIHSSEKIAAKGEKYTEVVYPLADLENREKYSSKKSFYNSVKAPAAYFKKNDIGLAVFNQIHDVEEYQNLYEKWVQQKIDRGVHRISFPIARYRHCIEKVNNNPRLFAIEARNKECELIAFRIVLIDESIAYDIVFVSDLDIPQLSNAFNYMGLDTLKRHDGVQLFNCGVSSGKLKQYKQQYPNFLKTVYLTGGENVG